jgi:tRNA modification GTPase
MPLDLARMDTICALASAQGYGALAILRASGVRAEAIFRAIFRPSRSSGLKPLMAIHGSLVNHQDETIDDVMAVFYPDTKGFTGEPGFEIFCHGNQLIIDEILQAICHQGARLAEPGEFSLRALLNGKIDLAQAESIADLIHAQSSMAKKIALIGVQGGLRDRCEGLRETVVSALAELEARMDFPDEDLGNYDKTSIIKVIDQAIDSLTALLSNAHQVLKLHEGARVVITGLPNAGKSTLLNRLCGEERAIVHETAGTTRDVIEAKLVLAGVPVLLVDVAGIRADHQVSDIERIGIERAFLELKRAQVVIWLADCTSPDPFGDPLIKSALETSEAPVIKVLNKAELAPTQCGGKLAISAALGNGIEDLKAVLTKHLVGEAAWGEVFITRARQKEELEHALKSFKEAKEALRLGLVEEVVTSELRAAGRAFDRLFGTTIAEDVLDRIFSQFCIGK